MKWSTVNLGEVCEVISGATPKTGNPAFWDGDVPWVTPKDLSDNGQKYLADTPRKITEAGLKSCSAKMLPVESVLFSSRAPIGLVAINKVPVCTNQGFKSMVPRKGELSPDYLYWWLEIHREDLQRLGRGATFKEVSKKIVEGIRIPLPPLAEQKRIAAILDATDDMRAKRRESLAQFDTLLQSSFLVMFGDPASNPRGWPSRKLGDVLSLITYGLTVRPSYHSTGVPLISGSQIRSGYVDTNSAPKISQSDFEKLRSKCKAEYGDVLFAKTGSIGHSAILQEKSRVALAQNVARLVFKEGQVNNFFALYYLRTDHIQRMSQHLAKGNAQKDLQLGVMEDFPIYCPPFDLQLKFASIVKSVEEQKERLCEHLAELDTLFASLQQRAFNGDL